LSDLIAKPIATTVELTGFAREGSTHPTVLDRPVGRISRPHPLSFQRAKAQGVIRREPRNASTSGPKCFRCKDGDRNGAFRLEMPQIIRIFGQPHGHLAYDSDEFKTVFLRWLAAGRG
jgi:hypothetical protein